MPLSMSHTLPNLSKLISHSLTHEPFLLDTGISYLSPHSDLVNDWSFCGDGTSKDGSILCSSSPYPFIFRDLNLGLPLLRILLPYQPTPQWLFLALPCSLIICHSVPFCTGMWQGSQLASSIFFGSPTSNSSVLPPALGIRSFQCNRQHSPLPFASVSPLILLPWR